MNNRDKRSLQGFALALCALTALVWAPAVQADGKDMALQCVIDIEITPEGSSLKDLDFTLDFWKAKEIKCLGHLVRYSRGDFSKVWGPDRSIGYRAARLIREASVSHPAFAEYREKCVMPEGHFGGITVLVTDQHRPPGGSSWMDPFLVEVLHRIDESCQGRY